MLANDKLTLEKATSIAQSFEMVVKDTNQVVVERYCSTANEYKESNHQLTPKARNAKIGHLPNSCCFKKEHCHNFNKMDHIEQACTANSRTISAKTVHLVPQSNSGTTEHEYYDNVTNSPIMIPLQPITC